MARQRRPRMPFFKKKQKGHTIIVMQTRMLALIKPKLLPDHSILNQAFSGYPHLDVCAGECALYENFPSF